MFTRVDGKLPLETEIRLDGSPHRVPPALSVAAAVLLLKGWEGYRRHQDGSARAPLCMMGVCHECLITIDGEPNRQGCLVQVAPGMRIWRQVDGGDAHE